MSNELYLIALALTLVVEYPIIWIGFRRPLPAAARRLTLPLSFIAINLFTHGSLWWLWSSIPAPYGLKVLLSETVVAIIEGLLYHHLLGVPRSRALICAGVANLLSTLGGPVLWTLLR